MNVGQDGFSESDPRYSAHDNDGGVVGILLYQPDSCVHRLVVM